MKQDRICERRAFGKNGLTVIALAAQRGSKLPTATKKPDLAQKAIAAAFSSPTPQPVEPSTMVPSDVAQRAPHSVPIADIRVPPERFPCDQERIRLVAESPWGKTLKPIAVVKSPDGLLLVSGEHWLEIAKARGHTHVACIQLDADAMEVRLAEITEVIYHAALTVLEKAVLIAEYVGVWEQIDDVSGQNVQESTVGRPRGGVAQAARVLCLPGKTEGARRKSAERGLKIATISFEAKDKVKRLGLDDHQSALLAIANVTPEQQVAKAQELADRKRERQRRTSATDMNTLDARSPENPSVDDANVSSNSANFPVVIGPPTASQEDVAHMVVDTLFEDEGQERAAFEELTAAWAAASKPVRQDEGKLARHRLERFRRLRRATRRCARTLHAGGAGHHNRRPAEQDPVPVHAIGF